MHIKQLKLTEPKMPKHNKTFYNSLQCHCDGTFSVAPDVFYQVYTIHGVIENAVIPLVYALLPNKTQEKFFGCLEQFGKKVVIDFEAAVRNAIKKCSLIQKFNSVSSTWAKQYGAMYKNLVFRASTWTMMSFDWMSKKWFAWHSFPLTTLFSRLRRSEKRIPQRNSRVYQTTSKTPILVLVEEIDASNQSLTLPIGTFSIGCSAENLVRTMRWRHGMAASISSYRQSIQPSPSWSPDSKMSKKTPKLM